MIRILVVNEVSPQKKNRTSILFEKVIPILLKKNEIKVFWLSYDYKKNEKSVDSWYELLHVHEFKNAKEVIEKTKPDLIYVFPGLSIIDYAFLLTARVLKIPTFGFIDGIGVFTHSKGRHVKKVLKIFTNEIFVKKKIDENNSEFRGTSYFKKNLFLIRSMRKIGNSYQHIIIEIIKNFRLYFNYKFQENEKHTRFNCNLLLIENELSVNYACNLGLSKNNMKVVGDPTYDLAFDEKYVEEEIESNRKINVLFITTNFNGGQGELEWSVQKQKQMIKELAEEYEKNKEKISLKIKIHPVSENYKDYEKILDGYNSNIEIFQHQNIFKLIKDADMIICPSASTAGLIALIMKKPIVVWNYFNIQGDVFLKEKITMNCNKISEIKACIDNRIKFIQENEVIIDNYIKKYCGEGNASQKCADAIYELILKSK